MHAEHLTRYLIHSMRSITVLGIIIKVKVRTGLQSLCCEISPPHHNHLTPASDAVRRTQGVWAWAVWMTRTSAASSRPLHLPAASATASLRKWGMCHIYGGALSHIRERFAQMCGSTSHDSGSRPAMSQSCSPDSVPHSSRVGPACQAPPSTPTCCHQPPPWIPQESRKEERDVEWCEWQLPKSHTGPPGFVNCY